MYLKRLRYWLDNYMSKGTPAIVMALFVLSGLIIVFVATLLFVFRLEPKPESSYWDYIWVTFLHTYDPSQLAYDDKPWQYEIIIFIACLAGLFLLSTLVGVLMAGFQAKILELRKGKTLVVEEDHTLILGWSEEVISVIREIIIANHNRKNACIVILSEKEKMWMEDEIRIKIGNSGNTRIVCRSGSPIEFSDLDIVVPHKARAVIVISPDNIANPDAYVMKVILALTSDKFPAPIKSIVCSLADEDNRNIARLIGGERISVVAAENVIAQIITQTCRQPGLSFVYQELLDFDGDEIYFQNEPRLFAFDYRDAVMSYETSTIIGIRKASNEIVLNPSSFSMLGMGDSLIAISEDDDTVIMSGIAKPPINTEAISNGTEPIQKRERVLILGWNKNAPNILRELDHYVTMESQARVVAERLVGEHIFQLDADLKKLDCTFTYGSITKRGVLDSLDIPSFDSVILLSYDDIHDVQEADSQTLVTLVHLRDIAAKSGKQLSIVSEMRDERNRSLVEIDSVHDFIVSHQLVSLLMTQLSENPELDYVFKDLFDDSGVEIYLKAVEVYVKTDMPVNFYTVSEAALRRNETAIGYKRIADQGKVKVNPKKSDMVTFQHGDMIVVLAEQ
ncbi:MAG: potassium transporter TrkA [Bacteriodetes bacterium]|nr:potassium transporter TrkA [Bacteroidota bacterium]